MEALEHNAQGLLQLTDRLGNVETRMVYAFAGINATLFDMASRLDYAIVLTEALINDEFHAGLCFYDMYLETADDSQLRRATEQYDNETIRKFAIRNLLRREKIREARHVLNRCCIALKQDLNYIAMKQKVYMEDSLCLKIQLFKKSERYDKNMLPGSILI